MICTQKQLITDKNWELLHNAAALFFALCEQISRKKLFLELLVKNLTFIFWCDIIKFSPKVEI